MVVFYPHSVLQSFSPSCFLWWFLISSRFQYIVLNYNHAALLTLTEKFIAGMLVMLFFGEGTGWVLKEFTSLWVRRVLCTLMILIRGPKSPLPSIFTILHLGGWILSSFFTHSFFHYLISSRSFNLCLVSRHLNHWVKI